MGSVNDMEEQASELVGIDQPVHRTNSIHPLTGKPDMARGSVGNRRRIEQLEFKLGHIICGHRSGLTGEYCTKKPVEGTQRCKTHQAVATYVRQKTPRYSLVEQVFQRCQLCRVANCDYRNSQSGGSECVIERDLYETLMQQSKSLEAYGEATQQLFEELVWVRVLLYRAYAQMASEGLTIKEVTGFTGQGAEIVPIMNEREHPVLKHIAKLHQVDKQLCDALELTPMAKTRRGEAATAEHAQNNFSDLLKQAFQRFGENNPQEAE